ncbi:DUF2231 domain-containing protein [Saccharothrix sp. Mg75]|uniref:DUF2231 domain-containing protein n=1 Tax=Saccharothrix sp. Mg75 TaxID=3445357 RepID=UPI003EEB6731
MSGVQKLLRWVETSPAVDKAAGALAEAIPATLRRQEVTNLLRKRALGKPVHPAVVVLPMSFYAASAALDLAPGGSTASRALIGAGLAAAPAALATELAEYGTLDRAERRTAFVHLAANATATACYLTSFRLRGHGFGLLARALSAVGLAALAAGGALSAHQALLRSPEAVAASGGRLVGEPV